MLSNAQDASSCIFQILSQTPNAIPEILVELVQESRALFDASYHKDHTSFRQWKGQVAIGKRNFHFALTYYISKAFSCMCKGWFADVRSFLIARKALLAFLYFFKEGQLLVEHFYYPWGSNELDFTAALTAIHQLLDPHWDWILPFSGVRFKVPPIVFPFPPTNLSEYVMIDTDLSWNALFKVSTKVNPLHSAAPVSVQASASGTPSELDLDWFTQYVAEIHATHPTLLGFMQKIFEDHIRSKRCTFELPDLSKHIPADYYFRSEQMWGKAAWMGDSLGYKVVDDTLHRHHSDADPRFHSACTRVFAENRNLTALLRARGYIRHDRPMKNHDGGTQEEAYLFLAWETSWKDDPKELIVWSDDNVEPIVLHMELAFVAREEILRWERLHEEFPRLPTYDEWKLEAEIEAYSPRKYSSPPTKPSSKHFSELEQDPWLLPETHEGLAIQTAESTLEKSSLRLASQSSLSSSSLDSLDTCFSSAGPSCSSSRTFTQSPPPTSKKFKDPEDGEKENIPPFDTGAASSRWGSQSTRAYHPYRRQRRY